MQWCTIAVELIDSKTSWNQVDIVLNDSSSGSCKWKAAKAVQFCRSNELLQISRFFNQPVSSEEADCCTGNYLIAIFPTGGSGFPSCAGNVFV